MLSRKVRFITTVLLMLLISTMCSFVSGAYASGLSVEQKGLSIIGNVAGVDVAQYSVASETLPQSYSFLDVKQEDVVSYSLQSASSKMNVSCTFDDGKLHLLYVLGSEGSPALTKTASTINGKAQNYMSDYTTYTQNSIYAEAKNR
jgi:hypothetical protein